MKTRDSVPISLTEVVGGVHFVDSCLFLVFSSGKTLRGLKQGKGTGEQGSYLISQEGLFRKPTKGEQDKTWQGWGTVSVIHW